jgi:hypothetical protein
MDTLGMLLTAQSPTKILLAASPLQWIHPSQPKLAVKKLFKIAQQRKTMNKSLMKGLHRYKYKKQ